MSMKKDENLPQRVEKRSVPEVRGMRVFHREVTLSERKKELYPTDFKNANAPMAITAQGYRSLNGPAGGTVLTPPAVIVDGVEQKNPHVVRDPKSHTILSVTIRKIGAGRTISGMPVFTDQTISYLPEQYFMRELLRLCEKHPDIARIASDFEVTKKVRDTHSFWKLTGDDDSGYDGILVKRSTKEYLDLLKNLQETRVFADRRADSVAERRCLFKLPLTSHSVVEVSGSVGNREGKLVIQGFVETPQSENEIKRAAKAIQSGKEVPSDLSEVRVIREDVSMETAEEEERMMEQQPPTETVAPVDKKGESVMFPQEEEKEKAPSNQTEPAPADDKPEQPESPPQDDQPETKLTAGVADSTNSLLFDDAEKPPTVDEVLQRAIDKNTREHVEATALHYEGTCDLNSLTDQKKRFIAAQSNLYKPSSKRDAD